ncbi:MAG: SPOR domain-containing protein [Smithellaceae bacterium]
MGSDNIKKFELKLGRTGVIIVIAGMAVLLCSSFILGVGFGRNIDTYPENVSSLPQRFLALFWRPAKVASQQEIAAKDVPPDKGNMDLAFHNALINQKTPSMQQAPAVANKPDSEAIAVDQTAIQQVPTEVEPAKEEAYERKVTVSEKSSAAKKPVIKEVPAASSSAGSSFLVHVASMKDKGKANQIAKTVASLGYPTKVSKADIKGKGIFYRVTTRGFETKAKAQTAADKISGKVNTKCIILPVGADMDKHQ